MWMWGHGPSASARHRAGAIEDNEGGRLGADAGAPEASGMGVGWGASRPGEALAPRSPGPGLGSGAARGWPPSGAGSGMSGPWAGGRARPPPLTQRSRLSRGRRSSSGRDTGSSSCGRLRPPWPGPTARSAVPGPPPAAPPPPRRRRRHGAEPPGRQGGPGRPTDRRTDGPLRCRLPPALRLLGGAGQAGAPARAPPRPPPPARPHAPRAAPPPAPAVGPARPSRRGDAYADARDPGEARESVRFLHQLALGMERGQEAAG
ncbi:WAS/WASL-interacting protein family member 2-like [Cricetulus griseus]|uniref:WAS/WASL-interacting protein family member 2-like n=1 Tax=Cricetulus griseus TaxID=10029 RepID=A0A9J7JBN4_CRIGR|nr:WAS/WASL-interacting protein family member 2-like [Cricetulus griseus]